MIPDDVKFDFRELIDDIPSDHDERIDVAKLVSDAATVIFANCGFVEQGFDRSRAKTVAAALIAMHSLQRLVASFSESSISDGYAMFQKEFLNEGVDYYIRDRVISCMAEAIKKAM